MDVLIEKFLKSIKNTDFRFKRYLHSEINWSNRLIGITGPRGIGKTTLVFQQIKENLDIKKALYVTAEDFYFASHKLVDLADEFEKLGGKHLFIDEIHKYENWSRELKLIYDYYPGLNIVFTGSSVLDIKKGASDLSRRAVMYYMQGLSFREYLELFEGIKTKSFSLNEIIQNKVELAEIDHPLLFFKQYLKKGYYPYSLEYDFEIRTLQVINQTLESDIPFYAGMNVSTGRKLKQLLAIISESVPFKPNFSKIASKLLVSRNNIADYCNYIEEAGLIIQLRDKTSGIRGLGKVNKIFLDNTNLLDVLAGEKSEIGNIRETFFFNQTKLRHNISSSQNADFEIDEYTFEIGGKNKMKNQIRAISNAFIVKDDIEFGSGNTIPLWHFGMMY